MNAHPSSSYWFHLMSNLRFHIFWKRSCFPPRVTHHHVAQRPIGAGFRDDNKLCRFWCKTQPQRLRSANSTSAWQMKSEASDRVSQPCVSPLMYWKREKILKASDVWRIKYKCYFNMTCSLSHFIPISYRNKAYEISWAMHISHLSIFFLPLANFKST